MILQPTPQNTRFTFIDLFAGIGGFRIALNRLGGKCLFTSEWDEKAVKTYQFNFGGENVYGDITLPETKAKIPSDFDILCAGFPCQPFSIAGHRKGFEDTRGTLFFDVAEIVKSRMPKAIFLENVKNLASHDSGNTLRTIISVLRDELHYTCFYKVLNASKFANIPQNRERIFIVCFRDNLNVTSFPFPCEIALDSKIQDCINPVEDNNEKLVYTPTKMSRFKELKEAITRYDTIYQWRRQYVRENQSNLCPTLTANMGEGGHNVPLILCKNGKIRKLSPHECLAFQGFPQEFCFPDTISESSKYKQAGNSVVVPLIERICKEILTQIL